MKIGIKKGDKVINPDSENWSENKEESPNYIGEVTDLHCFNVEGEMIWFAKVQMRDYEGNFAVSILHKQKK